MRWTSVLEVAQLIQKDRLAEIKKTMDPYSLEVRRCITFIKYKRSSLLFIAVINCRITIVSYFLKICEADPNSFGYMGGKKLTCLAAATCLNSDAIVRILLIYGADTELASSYQTTPLLYACAQNRVQIAKYLVENGANVNSHNGIGESCLVESMNNIELFKYLVSMGADVNSVGDCGQTVLMLAIENQRDEIISFLLSCAHTDVRLKNDCQEDAFCLALRHSPENIIDEIIKKGSYNKKEIIRAYELESCLFHVRRYENKSNELWEKALQLRDQSDDKRIFGSQIPSEELQKVIKLLNPNDSPALIYLESEYGLYNIFTLQVFTKAANNVHDVDKYIVLCEFFFEILGSFDDGLLFAANSQIKQLIQHYFGIRLSSNIYQILQLFNRFSKYATELRVRFERMTPQQRMHYAQMMECFLYFTSEFIELIYLKCPNEMDLFHEGIRRIITADLRGSRLKSLTQMCGRLHCPTKIMEILFLCRANVNNADVEGKTVLHEVIESAISDKKIVELIMDNGFDFGLVKCEEYCLPCRMERDGLLPNPIKLVSLQCLAARTFCEEAMNYFRDVPHHLMTIVNSHMYLL